jgi:hypothetical protein
MRRAAHSYQLSLTASNCRPSQLSKGLLKRDKKIDEGGEQMINKSPGSKLIAALSRRSFFGHAAVAGGAVLLGSSIPNKAWAQDEGLPGVCDFPVPIPHINTPPPGGAHFYFPGPVDGSAVATDPSGAHPEGRDPSVIFNFKGFIGAADLNLSGTGTDLTTGESAPYTFHTDMRFMRGVFVGTDEIERRASFAFV